MQNNIVTKLMILLSTIEQLGSFWFGGNKPAEAVRKTASVD